MFTTPRQLSLITAAIMAASFTSFLSSSATAQVYTPGSAYAPAPPVSVPAQAPAAPQLTADQIDQLTGPIALYPDPLLAQLLPAATYPDDIAAAAQFLSANPQPTEDAINAQSWDPSVKAIVHYPTVLQQMSQNMDWTQALGAAFINQQQDVMDSIQRLRADAQNAGSLATNQQQQVEADSGVIQILPANPDVIYVPTYDPQVVYVQSSPLAYGAGFRFGNWLNFGFDWGHHWVTRDYDWAHHRPGVVDRRPDIAVHPWVRDTRRTAPVMPQRYINRAPARPMVRPGYEKAAPGPARAFNPAENRQEVQRAENRGRQSIPQVHPAARPVPVRPAPAPRPAVAPRPVEAPHPVPAPRPVAPARPVVVQPRPVVAQPRPAPAAPRPVVQQPRAPVAAPHPAPAFNPGGAGVAGESARGRASMQHH